MTSKAFPKEYLIRILDEDVEGASIVSDEITDQGRWNIQHEMIFKDVDGLFYVTDYSVGATEYQDERPFENSGDPIACVQVHQVPRTVLVWEAVGKTNEDDTTQTPEA